MKSPQGFRRRKEGVKMKRLLNKKGSVLFLVLVVMSLLIIAASATYYVVNNQRSSVNIRYSSEQSYQTALSVSDTVSDYIDGYIQAILKSGLDLDSLGSDNVICKMLDMGTGSGASFTTKDLDFKDIGMGDVKVVITKVKAEPATDGSGNTINTYEIATIADVNGETSTIKQYKQIITGPTEYFTRFLTSTGGDPADVTFAAYRITSDAYFENEYTRISGVGESIAVQVSDSIYSTGTLEIDGIQQESGSKKLDIVVAEDLIFNASGTGNNSILDYGGRIFSGHDITVAKGRNLNGVDEIYALGDFHFDEDYGSFTNTKVYVGGDCRVKHIDSEGSDIYVNGDLYIAPNFNDKGRYHVSGDVYLNDNVPVSHIEYGGELHKNGFELYSTDVVKNENLKTNKPFNGKIGNAADGQEVKAFIAEQTAKNEYQEWNAEGYFDKLGVTKTVQPGNDGGKICYIKDNCILKPSIQWTAGGDKFNIVIDTTGRNSDIYIKLQPLDGKTFRFVDAVNCSVNVIVKGPRSVIFVLPQNVNFETNMGTFVGHIESAKILTGETDESKLMNMWLHNGADSTHGSALTDCLINTTVDSKTNAVILDKSKFPTGSDIHNNIYLVNKGKSNIIDATNSCTFLGYIYSPNGKLVANDLGGAKLAFLGGMIVGSYTYIGMGTALAFTTPYDYTYDPDDSTKSIYGLTKPTDIVKHLIAFANSGGSGSSSSTSKKIEGFKVIGYR